MTDKLDNLDNLKIVDDEPVKKNKPKKDYTKYYYWLFALFILTSILAVVGKEAQASFTSKMVVDVRPCEYNVKGMDIKGKRYYTYRYREVFGIRFIDVSKIDERTDILHEFKGTNVIGMNGAEWWSLNLGKGEQTVKTLGKAESYTFVQDGLAGVVSYDNFCK